ncbi:MAG: DNA alkylation repair protein [Gallionella sp.]
MKNLRRNDHQLTYAELREDMRALGNPEVATHSQRFFKTGRGEYGEGDQFLGIRVPLLRRLAKNCNLITLDEITQLLQSAFHEERLCALLLLVHRFMRGSAAQQTAIYRLYLANTACINNWDLVDSSANQIVGRFLECKDKKILFKLARSNSIWERRIAIISTLHFIRSFQFDVTLELATRLINDDEDLIHKAVGWMLREIGKRDMAIEEAFLRDQHARMPRTMLRYAIEKFPERTRQQYLSRIS